METVILLKSFLLIRNALLGMWPHLPNKWQLNDLTCSFGIAFMTSGQIDFSSRSCEIWQSYRHQWRSLWYVWFLFRSPIAGQYIYWWWCYDIIEGPDHVLLLLLQIASIFCGYVFLMLIKTLKHVVWSFTP